MATLFFEVSLKWANSVDLPVPALPVMNKFLLEFSNKWSACLNSGLISIFVLSFGMV